MELIFQQCKDDNERRGLLLKRFNKSGGRYSYAFHTAVYYGSIKVVEFLLEKAEALNVMRIINYQQYQGHMETPLNIAENNKNGAKDDKQKHVHGEIYALLTSNKAKLARIKDKPVANPKKPATKQPGGSLFAGLGESEG